MYKLSTVILTRNFQQKFKTYKINNLHMSFKIRELQNHKIKQEEYYVKLIADIIM